MTRLMNSAVWVLLTELAVLCFLWSHFRQIGPTPIQAVGCFLVMVFLTLVLVARRQLGSSFTVTAKARALVTTGLYSKIRNPIYVFGVVAILGMGLVLSSWIPVVVVLLLLPIQGSECAKRRPRWKECLPSST